MTRKAETTCTRSRVDVIDAELRQSTDIDGFDRHSHWHHFCLVGGEEVSDQEQESISIAAHGCKMGDYLGRQVAVGDQVQIANDRGQRRAELVGDKSDELVLHTDRMPQRLLLLLQSHDLLLPDLGA